MIPLIADSISLRSSGMTPLNQIFCGYIITLGPCRQSPMHPEVETRIRPFHPFPFTYSFNRLLIRMLLLSAQDSLSPSRSLVHIKTCAIYGDSLISVMFYCLLVIGKPLARQRIVPRAYIHSLKKRSSSCDLQWYHE
jgi:hypothetical protein